MDVVAYQFEIHSSNTRDYLRHLFSYLFLSWDPLPTSSSALASPALPFPAKAT